MENSLGRSGVCCKTSLSDFQRETTGLTGHLGKHWTLVTGLGLLGGWFCWALRGSGLTKVKYWVETGEKHYFLLFSAERLLAGLEDWEGLLSPGRTDRTD